MTHFTTFSGNRINYQDIDPEQISVVDISHSLSQLCRFAGHTKYFYSVAQHCLNCMEVAKEVYGANIETQYWMLMHDAAEAYISDIPRGFKQYIDEIIEAESMLQYQIMLSVLGLRQNIHFFKIFALNINENITNEIDDRVLVTEAINLFNANRAYMLDIEPIDGLIIEQRRMQDINVEFLRTANNLITQIKSKYEECFGE